MAARDEAILGVGGGWRRLAWYLHVLRLFAHEDVMSTKVLRQNVAGCGHEKATIEAQSRHLDRANPSAHNRGR